jgi:YfiH family protein
MNKHSRDSLEFYSFGNSGKYPELTNISTTRIGGSSSERFATLNLGLSTGDDTGTVLDNRRRLSLITGVSPEALTLAGQVHGANVAAVTGAADAPISATDAMITSIPEVPLVILVADCAVVSLYDPVNRAVGVVHAGWKGTVAGLAAKTVMKMAETFGSDPGKLVAGIGPSIGPCCYEVGGEVIDRFVAADPEMADRVLADPGPDYGPRYQSLRGNSSTESRGREAGTDKKYLDLWLANSLGLRAASLKEENVEIAETCTACNTERFYSHRAEQSRTGRFAGLIMIHGKTKRVY